MCYWKVMGAARGGRAARGEGRGRAKLALFNNRALIPGPRNSPYLLKVSLKFYDFNQIVLGLPRGSFTFDWTNARREALTTFIF